MIDSLKKHQKQIMYRSIEEVCDLFTYYLCKHLCRLTNQREFVRRINEKTYVNRDALFYRRWFINESSSSFFLACLFPFGAWLFRVLDHFSLLLSFICSTSLVLSLYILFLIIQQSYLIINGQTWHEYGKNIQIYNAYKNLQSNIEIVFGKRWFFVFFSPLVSSPPIGDGMTFDATMSGDSGDIRRMGIKRT